MENDIILAPSILQADFLNLGSVIKEIEVSRQKWVHLDIMDGHFVPNLSFGPSIVSDIRKSTDLFLDTHLMLDNPDKYIDAFAEAGSDNISIHIEPSYDVLGTLRYIKSLGKKASITINPDTNVEKIIDVLPEVFMVLVMSVNPGFGGQSFIEKTLEKVEFLAKFKKQNNLDFRLQMDGGINAQNVKKCILAGANTIVAGSGFFKDKNSLIAQINSI